ncbi:hypothetical protein C943_01202 [Mariniradius saccharolyticus AK6]|uniref:Uncharacterized protein n=1 Tax=Mariniradius saccharolyticus AK6 TaxID=1239962 RepID=M7X4V8_9BACT|nr:hypothetical protein C943_01202 [Mariniradius saccharolyticus AK6]
MEGWEIGRLGDWELEDCKIGKLKYWKIGFVGTEVARLKSLKVESLGGYEVGWLGLFAAASFRRRRNPPELSPGWTENISPIGAL